MPSFVRGTLIGSGITIAIYVVPILHFVGPFIGGFLGASMAQVRPTLAIGLGALMALLVGVVGAALSQVLISVLTAFSIELSLGSGGARIALVVGGLLAMHTFALGSLGALVGGMITHKAAEQEARAS